MNRPSEKLLKDMSGDELAIESEWHAGRAAKLYDTVSRMREDALHLSGDGSIEALQEAAVLESEAEAHLHQSNILDMIRASRLSSHGVGKAEKLAA